MSDFFEVDFREVNKNKSGDAISIRYEISGITSIHVVDAGYKSTGGELVDHILKYYGRPEKIDHVVVTHPDQDHAEGLQEILANFKIGTLWMLRPWEFIDELMPRFARYTVAENLKKKLKEAYPYIHELEKIAIEKKIPMKSPFQGALIGAFTVLAPSRDRYLDLVVTSTKTPEESQASGVAEALRKAFATGMGKIEGLIKAAWGMEHFPTEGTSNENEMSVVQFARICGKSILLTADAGRDGLEEAADYADDYLLELPGGLDYIQIPHHGGRRNVSSELLDRWLGPKLSTPPAAGSEKYIAIVSAARDDPDHPRKVVVRAFMHRGAKVLSTDEGPSLKKIGYNAPSRKGWTTAAPVPYPTEMEEE